MEEFRQGCYLVKDSYPMRFVGEFTVKTLGPGVLNEDQKSRDSIKNEENLLKIVCSEQKSASKLAIEFGGCSAYMF